jgi:hypothetical protein
MIRAILSSETPDRPGHTGEYTLGPDVILVLVHDGTARLLDMDGRFYAVSAIGAEMLQESLEQDSEAAVNKMVAQYGEGAQRVRRDLADFLQQLEKRRLIKRRGSIGRRRALYPPLPFVVLAPSFRFIQHNVHSLKAKAWSLLTLARFSFYLFGWARTIAAWQQYYHNLSYSGSAPHAEETAKAVDEVVRTMAAQHLFDMGCKERSLCCWALLRSAGLPATVVLGINLFPLASHCWCESSSLTLSDYQDQCEKFTPVMRYE